MVVQGFLGDLHVVDIGDSRIPAEVISTKQAFSCMSNRRATQVAH